MPIDRRTFLQMLSAGALSASFPASISRALEIPANHSNQSIDDVEHIVILMQENRSFDHYFGMLSGVRGFSDPRAVNLSSGKPVWYQPSGNSYVLPFHPGAPNLGLQFLQDLDHGWDGTHQAWNKGNHDKWVPAKTATTMAYLNRSDIPFHYALADAFTICDAYHCSLMGPTDPNRHHMWTGWVGNDGKNGGPIISNVENGSFDWSTYPERLEKAGVSWKIYQDIGTGLDKNGGWGWTNDNRYIGNYGDNSLLYYKQYENAKPGTPLYDKARTGTNISVKGTLFDNFQQDVLSGNLPQVSWICAPEAYTEHPNWPANYGAWYVSQILDALTARPEIWSKTAFFLTYDENDGFFDHMVPPTPPPSANDGISTIETTNELYRGNTPYGLGIRVPMVVISPWSKGGWVNSQVFDHTSLIRFIESRFGPQYNNKTTGIDLTEANITPWRRAVAGDLTSAFDFTAPDSAMVSLPSTVAYLPPDNKTHPDYVPAPPAVQALPVQEVGMRPARALPYTLDVNVTADLSKRSATLNFGNTGTAAAVFHIRSGYGNRTDGPWTYTIEPGKNISDTWNYPKLGTYDLAVYGPNGFFRAFKGSTTGQDKANLNIVSTYDIATNSIILQVINQGAACQVSLQNVYTNKTDTHDLASKETLSIRWSAESFFGWYDFVIGVVSDPSFQQHIAGHIETGEHSMSDPAIGHSMTC